MRTCLKCFAGCVLAISTLSISTHLYAQQHLPTPAEQKRIDEATANHVGDAPDSAGPLAKDLSPKLKPKAIEAAMRKVADWELQRSQPYFGNDWTWSVLYTGFMAASEATGDSKYSDAMLEVGKKFNWQLKSHLPNADNQSIGQTYTELYMQKHDPEMIAGTTAELDNLIAHEQDPAARIPWWWCDALYMAPPLWVRMYAMTHDGKYLDYMDREWWKTSNLLYDPQEHLYFRDATYLNKTEQNGQKMFWSRGNGWVLAGLAEVLETMPKDYPSRAKYVEQFRQMAEKVKSLQGADGLWQPGLLGSYPLPEVSGSAFFVYAMAWGINHGVLNRAEYLPVVRKGWAGLLSHVYADGRLGSIQPIGGGPDAYKPQTSYVFGVGAFLMAGSELRELAGH